MYVCMHIIAKSISTKEIDSPKYIKLVSEKLAKFIILLLSSSSLGLKIRASSWDLHLGLDLGHVSTFSWE